MLAHWAVGRPKPTQPVFDSITARGLHEADAKVVRAGAEVNVKTLTRDKGILNRAPDLSEVY